MNSSLWDSPVLPQAQDSAPAARPDCAQTVAIGSSGVVATPSPRGALGQPALPRVPGYELFGVIGVGGMGIVYKARHRELNRVVALKMLGREWEADADSRERFRREAEAVARLQHPNIIQLFDIGTCDREAGGVGQPYMALEYVDGGSLSRFAGSPQDPKFAAGMVEKLARAAGAAHKVGVIHRDLKPANVLLTASPAAESLPAGGRHLAGGPHAIGTPKIADFGLAKQLDPGPDEGGRYRTQAGTIVGTPEYMAPEQVDGRPPTPAVDVYALGVLLYELFTGRVPLKGASLMETLLMARLGEPVPPRQLQPTLPRDLETICLKCLEKAPDKRYATADELADDLARWLDGKTIQARPAGRVERATRWVRRNPTAAGWMAAAVLTFVIGLSAVLWKWRDAEASAAEAARNAATERWERYRATLRAAGSAFYADNVAAARRALVDAPDEHRGWEWAVLDAQLDVSSRLFRVPELDRVRFAPDGKHVVTYGGDKALRLWELSSGTEVAPPVSLAGADYWTFAVDPPTAITTDAGHAIRVTPLTGGPVRRLAGHTAPVTGVRLTADGRRAVSSSRDGTVRVWDVPAGRQVTELRFPPGNPSLHDMTPTGDRVVVSTGDRRHISVLDVAAERFTRLDPSNVGNGGQFTPDGRFCVSAAQYPHNVLTLFDAATGEFVGPLKGHENTTTSAAFSRDGSLFATGSMDRTACLWNLHEKNPEKKLRAVLGGHGGWVVTVAVSADGTRVATGSADKTVRLWTSAGKLLAVLRGHDGDIHEVGFSADGRELYSSSADGTIRAWDVPTAERRGLLRGHTDFVYDVAFLPDDRRVLSASWDGTAALWDTATGRQVQRFLHPGRPGAGGEKPRVNHVNAVAVHPNGRVAATLSRLDAVSLWDLTAEGDTPTPRHVWTVPTDDWRVARLAFAPTGTLLACGGMGGKVRLYDWETTRSVGELSHPGEVVEALAFSPDGRWLVSASAETARVWEVATRRPVAELTGHTQGINCLAFSADGTILASAACEGTVRLWAVEGWRERAVLRHGAVKVYTVAFHPTENRLATGCSDSTIRLWDVARGQEVAELRGHDEYVHSLAFSRDGQRLVSGSGDKTIRVWDATPVRR